MKRVATGASIEIGPVSRANSASPEIAITRSCVVPGETTGGKSADAVRWTVRVGAAGSGFAAVAGSTSLVVGASAPGPAPSPSPSVAAGGFAAGLAGPPRSSSSAGRGGFACELRLTAFGRS